MIPLKKGKSLIQVKHYFWLENPILLAVMKAKTVSYIHYYFLKIKASEETGLISIISEWKGD